MRGNCMRKTVEKSPRIISRGKYIQYRGRVEIGGVYLPSQLERTLQLVYVMVDIVKRGGRAPPTLTRLG